MPWSTKLRMRGKGQKTNEYETLSVSTTPHLPSVSNSGRQLSFFEDDMQSMDEFPSIATAIAPVQTCSNPYEGQEEVFLEFDKFLHSDRHLMALTCKAYLDDLRLFCKYLKPLGIALLDAKEKDVEGYLADLSRRGRCDRTRWRKLESLKRFYGMSHMDDRIARNPTLSLTVPKTWTNVSKALSEETVAKMLDKPRKGAKGLRDTTILKTIYGSGLRASEVAGVMLSHVDIPNRTMFVTGKRDKDRTVVLTKESAEAITTYLNIGRARLGPREPSTAARKDLSPEQLKYAHRSIPNRRPKNLFLSTLGNQLTRQSIYKIVKEANPDADVHSLRHSFASHLWDHGVSLEDIRIQMGHEDVATTTAYLKEVSVVLVSETHRSCHVRARRERGSTSVSEDSLQPEIGTGKDIQ